MRLEIKTIEVVYLVCISVHAGILKGHNLYSLWRLLTHDAAKDVHMKAGT